jgi:hypothetical protein
MFKKQKTQEDKPTCAKSVEKNDETRKACRLAREGGREEAGKKSLKHNTQTRAQNKVRRKTETAG